MDVTKSELYAAIHAQPGEMRRLLADGAATERAAAALGRARRIHLIGIGTSYHAALAAAWLFRAAGRDARAVHSFEFAAYAEPVNIVDAYVVISHRGTKTYSERAAQQIAAAGAPLVVLTALGAPAPAGALHVETVPAERSSTYTVSYTGALVVLAQIAAALGAAGLDAALHGLPDVVEAALAREDGVRGFAASLPATTRLAFIGGGPNAATASEAALKVKEAAYMTTEGMGVEQFLHGPLVALGEGDTLVAITAPGPAAERVAATAGIARDVGVRTVFAGIDPAGGALHLPGLERLPEVLTPIAAVVPLQLLACFLAAERGANPDSFRQDDPRYKAAFGKVRL